MGSRAPRSESASSEISMPVISAPPTYSPSRETTSKVVAVPKSTHTASAAEALADRDRVDEPVGADLARVVVADRHAGLGAGADGEHLVAEVALGHRGPLRLELRHGRGDDRRVEIVEPVSAQLEQAAAAPRRARRPWTGARSRSASARAAARPGTPRNGSACYRRRQRAALATIMLGATVSVPAPKLYVQPGVASVRRGRGRADAEVDRLRARRPDADEPTARRPFALRRAYRARHAHRLRARGRLARDHARARRAGSRAAAAAAARRPTLRARARARALGRRGLPARSRGACCPPLS